MQRKERKLQTTIILFVYLMVAAILLLIYFVFSRQFALQARNNMEERVVAVSRTIALTPPIYQALRDPSSKFDIQQYSNRIRRLNDIDFVVVIDMNAIRRSHPDPEMLGLPVKGGDEQRALQGEHIVTVAEGTLGLSLRSYAPIYDQEGNQVGAALCGVLLERVNQEVKGNMWILYWGIALVAVIGTIGAHWLARKIKLSLNNMEPYEIARMLKERNAMLHSAKEGIVTVNAEMMISLINEEGRKLFRRAGLPEKLIDEDIRKIWPSLGFEQVIQTGEAILDQELALGGVIVRVNCVPVLVNGHTEGAIATFRDKTEITLLGERLSGLAAYAEALRAQSHEFRNKLHVIYGMIHMKFYDELNVFIETTLEAHHSEVGAVTEQIRDQVMAGFILGKMSRAREAGIELVLLQDSFLPEARHADSIHALITIIGNLLDNAVEAQGDLNGVGIKSSRIELSFRYTPGKNKELAGELVCRVCDHGAGIAAELQQKIFEKGFSTKGEQRGMGLYLVQVRLQEMGGRLEVDSGECEGTCMTVSIPYLAKEAAL